MTVLDLAPVLGSGAGIAALEAADHSLLKPNYGISCLCPPLGATAVILFAMSKAPAAQPRSVLGAYIVASVASLAVLTLLPPEYSYLAKPLAVALTIAGMAKTETMHPPAGAYAFLFANNKMTAENIFSPGLVGAAILLAVQKVAFAVEESLNQPEPKGRAKKTK